MRGLLLLAVLGCETPDTPFFARGGVMLGGDGLVYVGPVRMDFGRITLPLPTHLFVEDTDVLRAPDPCVPSLAGVQLYPAVTAIGDNPKGLLGELEVVRPGPAMLQLRSTYQVPYTCGAESQLSGTTTWTFLPNGRITRVDENLIASTAALSTSGACSCSGTADPFSFTSFWAFASGEVFDATYAKKAVFDAPACIVIDKKYTLGVKYDAMRMSASDTTGYPIVEQDLGMQMQSWPPDAPPARAESHLSFVINPGTATAADCTTALEMINVDDRSLFVGKDTLQDQDGVYYATAKTYRGATDVRVPVSNTTGFALAIDLGGAEHVRVLYNGSESDTYIVQAFDEHVLFFFPGLNAGEVITIEPLD